MKSILTLAILVVSLSMAAQDKNLPYYEIPSYPESFTAGNVASRVVDGLGFRFYWATEGLREEDLAYKPGPDTRTSLETIEHIYGMVVSIYNATHKIVNEPNQDASLPFAEMRKKTLENLKAASEKLRSSSDAEMKELKLMYRRGDTIVEFPFWNHLNGPIADCLWHVGQIVTFRRSSGNPFTDNVSVFSGTVRK